MYIDLQQYSLQIKKKKKMMNWLKRSALGHKILINIQIIISIPHPSQTDNSSCRQGQYYK